MEYTITVETEDELTAIDQKRLLMALEQALSSPMTANEGDFNITYD